MTPEQKSTLEKQLNQLYELQKKKTSSNPTEVSSNSQLPIQETHPPNLKPVQPRGRGLFRAGHGPYRGRGHTRVHDAGSWSSGSNQGGILCCIIHCMLYNSLCVHILHFVSEKILG